jgi:hypothetical protein
MSVNKHRPHVLVLPEDDANSEIATGFVKQLHRSFIRSIQVLPVAGGWLEVLTHFESDHLIGMEKYPGRCVVLLIDFDRETNRLGRAQERIPAHLKDRVFILGALTEPEALRRTLGSYETIGQALAKDCREETDPPGATTS